MVRDNLQRVNQFDELKTIDPVRQEILDGNCYYTGYLFTAIADDTSANALLINGQYKTKFKFFVDANQTCDLYFYEETVEDTSGNAMSIFNFNRNSTNTFDGSAYYSPTVHVDSSGNSIGFKRIFASSTNPARGGSVAAEGEFSRILKPNTKYYMQVFNRSGGGDLDVFLNIRLCELLEYDD